MTTDPVPDTRLRGSALLASAIAAVLLALVGSSWSGAAETPNNREMTATVRLATDRTTFGPGEPVIVHVTLANPGERRVAILRWRTPLDGVSAPLFEVTHDGTDVPYRGRMAKRPEPTDADYVTLEPGASVTSDVDLAKLHDLAAPGHYVVTYDVTSPQLWLPKKNAPPADGHLVSEPLRFAVEGAAK